MAIILESLGADIFVPPPFRTELRWDVSFLDRWARQVRARFDDLNRKADSFTMYMQLHMGKGADQRHLTGRRDAVMSVREWKELSKEGSFIRSARIQRLDKLLADYHSHDMDETRLPPLLEMFDLVWEYCQESTTGSRGAAVMILGAQICESAKKGYPLETLKLSTEDMQKKVMLR